LSWPVSLGHRCAEKVTTIKLHLENAFTKICKEIIQKYQISWEERAPRELTDYSLKLEFMTICITGNCK
jgi:hypothetical protein